MNCDIVFSRKREKQYKQTAKVLVLVGYCVMTLISR